MKKLTYILSFLLFACSTEEPTKEIAKESGVSTLQKITEVHNNSKPFHIGKYSKHEVEVGLVEDKLVLVNTVNGVSEDFYIVQLFEKDIETFKNIEDGTFEIADLGAELILDTGNQSFYFSTLKNSQHGKIAKDAHQVSVLEISTHIAPELIAAKESEMDDSFIDLVKGAKCKCVWWSSYERCDAGGEGAKSCSNDDCAVSCNEGYYACCNSDD